MRKLVLAAALSGTMVTLAACSGGADEAAEAEAPTAVETTETTEAAAEAAVLDAGTATVEQLAAVEGVSEELAAAIRTISDAGMPLVVVEQDVEFLMELTDQLYMINHGEVAAQIRPGEQIDHEEIMAMYFGTGGAAGGTVL